MGYQPVWLFCPWVLITGAQAELTSDLLTMDKGFFPQDTGSRPPDKKCQSILIPKQNSVVQNRQTAP